MEDQYGMADLRNFINNRPLFTSTPHPQPPEFLSPHHRNLAAPPPPPSSHHPYEMVMPPVPRAFHHDFLPDSSTNNAATTTASVITGGGGGASSAAFSGLEMDAAGGGGGLGCDGGNGRWPRQETLTLLEIRSRLDPKFKEANQKGPLWDEVSRIMCEEHGYQRSGKKCREKFENLYKYYKKTKEGKAGRQDGKHYRFFRQLEALYGEPGNSGSVSETHHTQTGFPYNNSAAAAAGANNNTPQDAAFHHHHQDSKVSDSLSLSNSSDYDTTSSDDSDGGGMASKKRKGKGRWKAKIKDFIDGQMRKLMEKQEAWLDKIMKTIEHKEEERMLREDEWRKQEASRMEREQKFWANERAWIEARDSALMEALHKVTGNDFILKSTASEDDDPWPENEITKLIQIRNNMEPRFQNPQIGSSDDVLWEEIATKMSYLGFDRSATMCRHKWIHINNYLSKCNKKRKDEDENNNNNNTGSCYSFQNNNGGSYCPEQQQQSHDHHHPINAAMNDSCFRLLMGDNADNLWENYGLKLSKGGGDDDK